MNARMISDQLIDRSRTIWRMAEHQDRTLIKAALLDITLDAATDLSAKSMKLMEQYASLGPARQLRVVRDLLTLWRKIIRNIKAVNADHPMTDCHLYAVMLATWGWRMRACEKLFPCDCLTGQQRLYLGQAAPNEARARILEVLAYNPA